MPYASFGTDKVTVVSYSQTSVGALGAGVLTAARAVVLGCRHRSLKTESARGAGMARSQEAMEVGAPVGTEWWETTAPPAPAILAAKPSDYLEVDGQSYKIIGGVKPFKDGTGKIIKVSILSERQEPGF